MFSKCFCHTRPTPQAACACLQEDGKKPERSAAACTTSSGRLRREHTTSSVSSTGTRAPTPELHNTRTGRPVADSDVQHSWTGDSLVKGPTHRVPLKPVHFHTICVPRYPSLWWEFAVHFRRCCCTIITSKNSNGRSDEQFFAPRNTYGKENSCSSQ